ncbi:MAG: helicase, superfamily [Acidobacteria bacterium]|nr:helicase, superfamily [Acidobacteriota bacterium]
MPIPSRFISAFAPTTLQQVEAVGSRLQVKAPLFFRSAYTAFVVENERRTFAPIVVVEASRIARWWCSCNEQLRHGDLCRHLAVVVVSASADDGTLTNDRYEASFWRSIGFESFMERRELAADSSDDQRELMLRKYAMTPQEQALMKRGAGSTRLLWEASPWYRWSKGQFLRFGDASGATLAIDGDGGDAHLAVADARVAVPRGAVEYVVEAGLAVASGFTVAREALTPSLRVELTRDRALRFAPVLLTDDGRQHERDALPRYGRFFLDGTTFATPRNAAPMFGDARRNEQASLFEARPSSGLPFDRETLIAEAEVLPFLERHRRELAALPDGLAPEELRRARTLTGDDEVLFDFAAARNELLDVAVTFRGGEQAISAADIAEARNKKQRVVVRGNLWLDAGDPQFAWLDTTRFFGEGRLLLTKLEYLRIRGSIRGKAVFSGDASSEQIFRIFDDLHNASDAPPPATLGMDLYGYQQTGYQWLWLLQQNGFGGLLCDDMGLGKTHQAMALIRALTLAKTPPSILIVCPMSVLDHWREKLARYIPDVRFDVHHGSGRELRAGARAILTSYGVVRSDFDHLRGRPFDLIVLDEIQTIKNPGTATHQALRAIDRRIAIGLTGTPVENHERELKALLDFVVPGYLPREIADRPMLQRLVRPFVLRRTKGQVLPELPPKIVDKRYCELTPHQRAMYRSIIESRAKPLRTQLRSGERIPYFHVFAALNYLKQVCNHPASVGAGMADEQAPSGKWDLFVELLDECLASGLKVVVFSQYLAMLGIIERHLAERRIGFASIKGSTRDRGAETRRFRDDDECRVFTASLRAAGLGIDLTSASVVIHYDRWWNQAREDQATDRVHRLGQNKGVQVIKLITRGTLEEKIDLLVEQKAALAADLVQDDDPTLVKQFTPEELDELLEWEG